MSAMSGDQASGMSLTSCFVKGPDLVARQIAGETIIVPVRANVAELDCLFTLNEVGSLTWDLLDGRTTVGQIAEAICQAFDVAPEAAAADLMAFLDDLREAGVIQPASSGRR